jgi:hypothetical protein
MLAQTSAAYGEIQGTISDPSDAVIPAAVVGLTSKSTGFSRKTVTSSTGTYRFLLVPPGEYEVHVQSDGFRGEILRGVRVTVGQVANVDVRLQLGIVTETVILDGRPELIDSDRTTQANTLMEDSIRALPINRRDYLTFTLLAPGVADSTALADNTDLRVKAATHSGLSFYGSNGRGNSVTIDGGEANDGGGGVRSTLTQEAIQEFQINRSNYTAEMGGASGGIINIVSRAGTNAWHGSAFGFFRHEGLDAGDPFARVLENGRMIRIKPPSKRQQLGGSVSGPMRKEKTFVFGALEGLVRRESSVTSILTDTSVFDLTPAQQSILSAFPGDAAAALRAALATPQSTIDLFEANSGVFPYRTDAWRFSVRLDHHTGRDHYLLRHSYSDLKETNANVQALLGASRGHTTSQFDPTTLLGWTRVLHPRLVNEARVQWNYRSFSLNSVEPYGPEIRIAGYAIFNRDYLLPSRNIERRYELRDSVTWEEGAHLFKAGAQALIRGTRSESHVFFGGRFTFGDLPGSILNPALPNSFTITALQAFNLGLAQTYIQGAGDGTVASTNPFYALYIQDSWRATRDLKLDIGVRYELDTREKPLPTDTNNFAPRIGFAWSPAGSESTVVRGGYGIFYSPIYYQIDWSVKALNQIDGRRQIAQAFSSILTPGPAAAPNIYSTLRQQGVIRLPRPSRAMTPADLAQFGIGFTHTGPPPPFTILFENSADFVNPYAQHASVAIERELWGGTSVSAGYTMVRTLKITRSRDGNLLEAPVDPQLGIRVWSNSAYFADPQIAQLNIFESTARADYHALILEFKKRVGRSLTLDANYTLSRARDDVTDFNYDFQAADQMNLRSEWAMSAFHQRHKFVAYGVWDAPLGFTVAPIFRAHSGRPFNLLAGFDLNQDRHDTTDRPAGAGRNTGRGPKFATLDMRVAREFAVSENARLELTAEGFNALNRLNFASVNNVVGNMAGPFDVVGRHDRLANEPLGFTSAFDSRRIQLGVRVRF